VSGSYALVIRCFVFGARMVGRKRQVFIAVAPISDDQYPEPSVSGSAGGGGSTWRVVILALVFALVAAGLSFFSDYLPASTMLLVLGLFAVLGVFSVFAFAAGLFRIAGGAEGPSLSRAVVDSLPYGAVVSERDGKIVYANARYESLMDGPEGGQPVSVARLFANYSEASEAIYRLARAAREGRPAVEDIRLSQRLGRGPRDENALAQWYRVSVRALPKVKDAPKPLIVWSIDDISRDRDAQENIYLELQRAIDYLDHAPAGFFSADAEGRVQYINSTLADWLGYDLAELENGSLRLTDIVRGDGASLLMGGRSGGEIRTEIIDIDLVQSNGTAMPVRLMHRAARLAEGELGETRTLVLDRSRGVDMEEELRAVEVRFSRFFNDTPFAIATLDKAGRIVRTNAPFTRIFGVDVGQHSVEDLALSEVIGAEYRKQLASAVEDAQAKVSDIAPIDVMLTQEGDHAARLYFSSSEEVEGSSESVIVYALDMTEQHKLEAQFAQGQKMQAVGQLAGGVAHDFNNVLTAIIGFSDLLLLKHKPTDPSFSDIMSIKQSANRAAGLVRQLLAFSRRQTLRPQVLEITTHIDDLTVLLNRLIGEQIKLKVEHGKGIWPVRADLVQLEQVIINLVVNARDAMPDGGDISLRTQNVMRHEAEAMSYNGMPAAEYVLIEVEDEGTGIDPEIIEKIFDPFFSTKELGKGTGLGLSMVYGIVKQTGGFIYADSVLGKGTNFRIFLPRHMVEAGALTEKAAAAPVRDLTGHERILIVEDEESVRAFSARALSTTGYEVFEADGGEEALEVLEEIDYELDLLISDVVMPEMDGPALLKEVRKKLPNLKVIFVSGYAEESVRKDLEDDRSVEFLPKPYSLDQINSKVKEVLESGDEDDG
jgi:two-component system cell cycle sensor histidine kinase/response regulator CckA